MHLAKVRRAATCDTRTTGVRCLRARRCVEPYEIGDIGTASVGQTALAEDASTAAKNPAEMNLLDRSELMISPGALLPSTNFDFAPRTTPKGGGGNAGVFSPVGSFFQQLWIGEKWLWSTGFAHDSSPVSRANRNPVLPWTADSDTAPASNMRSIVT